MSFLTFKFCSVHLGKPSGGSTLGSANECYVNISNDILQGKIKFEKSSVVVEQTQAVAKLTLKRSLYTSG